MSEDNIRRLKEGLAALNARDEAALVAMSSEELSWRPALTAGVPLDVPVWGLWEIREGRFARGEAFLSEAEALEAVERLKPT